MEIKVEKIGKVFEGSQKETLKDIDLTIKKGEFICIVGPSGCGKSTLLNLIAGLEKPTEGTIYVDGKPVEKPDKDRVVMFQESALYPWLNVYDNVMLGMKLAGVPESERKERAEKYLRMVHLWDFREYGIHEISGGMKQRTALARALAIDSEILLMDEPFSALDKQTIHVLRKEVEDIWEQTGKTILFVTHSVEEAVYFSDRVIVLSENPGMVKEIVEVDIPRPRNIENEEFMQVRRRILHLIREEMEKIAKEEYDQNN